MTVQDRAPAVQGPAGAMPPDAAVWVREHVWTQDMRATHRTVPGLTQTCACQSGTSQHCTHGRHAQCVRGTPLRSAETSVCWTNGESPAHFPQPYAHQTDTSATGPRHETAALVWLADRVCRWICPCTCHTQPAEPDPPKAKRKRKPKLPPAEPARPLYEDVHLPDNALF